MSRSSVTLDRRLLPVEDVQNVLQIGRAKAYQVIRQLNSELKKRLHDTAWACAGKVF